MAKTQTFADKVNKKKGDGRVAVKVIKGFTSEINSTCFLEKIVIIDDVANIDKIDIN